MPAHTVESVSQRVESIILGTAKLDDPYNFAGDLRQAIKKHYRDTAQGKNGNCFVIAYTLACVDKKTLVHVLLKQGKQFVPHAWVEYGGIVVDLTKDNAFRYFKKSECRHNVVIEKRYRGTRINRLAVESTNHGPWDDCFDPYM